MENNTMEMNLEEMEKISGGKGAACSLKDLWPKVKSWIDRITDND